MINEPVSSSRPPPPAWAIHRRLYDWTLSLAGHKHATWVLVLISFSEAIFFPIPSIILQIPMTLERREKAWRYALINSVANVLGGIIGYGIGLLFSDAARAFLLKFVSEGIINSVEEYCRSLGLLTLGAVAIHPYKVYTIAAGLFKAPFLQFLIASIIGRFGFFFVSAALLYWIGQPARRFIEKYFNIATLLLGALVIAAVIIYRSLHHA
jgi:membrane protein YqaA with SNARE-associated domain